MLLCGIGCKSYIGSFIGILSGFNEDSMTAWVYTSWDPVVDRMILNRRNFHRYDISGLRGGNLSEIGFAHLHIVGKAIGAIGMMLGHFHVLQTPVQVTLDKCFVLTAWFCFVKEAHVAWPDEEKFGCPRFQKQLFPWLNRRLWFLGQQFAVVFRTGSELMDVISAKKERERCWKQIFGCDVTSPITNLVELLGDWCYWWWCTWFELWTEFCCNKLLSF